MLKFLSGKKRSRNVLLIIIVGFLAISLLGLFGVVVTGGAPGIFGGASGDDTVIAEVGGFDITAKELKDSLAAFSQQMAQGRARPNAPENLATTYALYPQVMDELIRTKLMLYEAERLNLEPSDTAVQARLRQVFSPWPGFEAYRARLQQSGMSPITFEENLRSAIAQEHLRSYVSAGAQVAATEVEDDYRRSNTQYSLRWVDVTPALVRNKVALTDAELVAFFDSRKEEFKITSEQRRARYIFIDQTRAGDAINFSEEELKQNFNPESYVNQVRVSQIVLNVPVVKSDPAKPADPANAQKPAAKQPTEDEIRNEAQDLVKRAQGGEGKEAEDFAKLARENSEDAKTKSNGGDLGWVTKSENPETDDPLSRAFTMKKDEVSQPIKRGDKYYILKVTDRKTPTLAEVRDRLIRDQRKQKSYSKAQEIAQQVKQKFKETKDAATTAAEVNKQYGMQLAVVRETPFFAQGDQLPDIGAAPQFQSAVFDLPNQNDVTEEMNVEKGFAVGQYTERRDPHDPTFEEVRSRVEERFRDEKSKELAVSQARQIAQTKSPDELKKVAGSLGFRVEERSGLSAADSFGPLTGDSERAPVYLLNPGQVTQTPISTETGDNHVVVAMLSKKDADMGDAFQKQKASIEQRLLDEKRNILFQTYLAETQKQLKDMGKIKIYDDAIDQILRASGPVPANLPNPTRRTRRGTGP
jgi:peptidyl-prolyl cis-trans isomerase D